MKITKIEVSSAYTINLGNYESLKPEVRLTAEVAVEDDQTLQQEFDSLRERANLLILQLAWDGVQAMKGMSKNPEAHIQRMLEAQGVTGD